MIELLKTEVQIWKTLKAEDIKIYVPTVFTQDDFKTITGEDFEEG